MTGWSKAAHYRSGRSYHTEEDEDGNLLTDRFDHEYVGSSLIDGDRDL